MDGLAEIRTAAHNHGMARKSKETESKNPGVFHLEFDEAFGRRIRKAAELAGQPLTTWFERAAEAAIEKAKKSQ